MPTTRQIFETFRKYRTDKGTTHHYERMYNKLFEDIGTPTRLAEIGIARGYSLAAWKALLPDTEITGVDVNVDNVNSVAREKTTIIHANVLRESIVDKLPGTYDVIIDDGDHRVDAQWKAFLLLENKWTSAYVIEDITGRESADTLIKRFRSLGYTPNLWDSAFSSSLRMSGEDQQIKWYALVVYPK